MEKAQLETVKPEPIWERTNLVERLDIHSIDRTHSAISDAFMGKTTRLVGIAIGLRLQDGSYKLTLRDAIHMSSAITMDHAIDVASIHYPCLIEITKFSVYAGDMEKWMVVQAMKCYEKQEDLLQRADQLFGTATMYRVTKRSFQEVDAGATIRCLITQLDPSIKRAEVVVRVSRMEERTYNRQSRTVPGQTEPGVFISFTCQDASGFIRAVLFDEQAARLRGSVQDGKVVKILNPVVRLPKEARYTLGFTTDYQLMFDNNSVILSSAETVNEPINIEF